MASTFVRIMHKRYWPTSTIPFFVSILHQEEMVYRNVARETRGVTGELYGGKPPKLPSSVMAETGKQNLKFVKCDRMPQLCLWQCNMTEDIRIRTAMSSSC